jgi:hypothetical protein
MTASLVGLSGISCVAAPHGLHGGARRGTRDTQDAKVAEAAQPAPLTEEIVMLDQALAVRSATPRTSLRDAAAAVLAAWDDEANRATDMIAALDAPMEALRVTPAQMQAARREAFVIRSKSNPSIWLWCLRVRAASGIARRSRRLRLFVLPNAEILNGRRRGQQQRAREILAQGFVPMFFLLRQVSLRKRLDVAGVRRRAPGILARALAAELERRA